MPTASTKIAAAANLPARKLNEILCNPFPAPTERQAFVIGCPSKQTRAVFSAPISPSLFFISEFCFLVSAFDGRLREAAPKRDSTIVIVARKPLFERREIDLLTNVLQLETLAFGLLNLCND
jgi:hypothetical protein